jgi:hypothetical protein
MYISFLDEKAYMEEGIIQFNSGIPLGCVSTFKLSCHVYTHKNVLVLQESTFFSGKRKTDFY